MPNVGGPNSVVEGLEKFDFPANYGNNFGGLEFPDSQAADYLGGRHTLQFSGRDSYGGNIDGPFPGDVSGHWGPVSVPYGLKGFIYGTKFSPATTAYESGWGRLLFSNYDLQVQYRAGCPNLRTDLQMPIQDSILAGYAGTSFTGTGFRTTDRSVTSVQRLNILDLISEGPIEGFVTGDYIYSTSGKKAGDIGYTSVLFSPFQVNTGQAPGQGAVEYWKATPESRSIFWNDTPIAAQKGFINFLYANYKYTYGDPNSHTISQPKINLFEDRNHYDGEKCDINKYPVVSSYTKLINEELYGGNFNAGPTSGYATPRRYYIYDTDIQAIKIHLKIKGLYTQVLTGARAGEYLREKLPVRFALYRLFSDRSEAFAQIDEPISTNPYLYAIDTVDYVGKVQVPTMVCYTFWMRSYKDSGYPLRVLPNQIGWVVHITKTVMEPMSLFTANAIEVSDIQCVYMDRFTYPQAAMVYSNFDSRYFSSVPERSYYVNLLKVKVPNNYDPIRKTYSGPWNGKFKLAWSDNPAWCYYDLVTNNRFGLGKYIDTSLVDKWSLYEAAQYCDQLVPNGNGGLEPRFTCNLYLANKAEAYKVLNDMASIFNAMPYYMAGQIFISQDRPKEPVYLFNNTNVVNGEFTYSDSSRKARRSVAMVRYNDEANNYKPALEYVEDKEAMMKYGIREVEVAAFGATRKSQARRLGKWFLASENLETETVTFDTSLEGGLLRPGDIVKIVDQNRQNKLYAGRVFDIDTGYAILDIPFNNFNRYILTGVNRSFTISFLTPSYNLYPGTTLGDNYLTGYNIASENFSSGVNSNLYRKSHVQELYIQNTQQAITSGTENYSNFIRINFSGINRNKTNKYSLRYSSTINLTGGRYYKTTADGWGAPNGGEVYSLEGYRRNVFAEASPARIDKYVMFGLNSDPGTDAGYTSLDYAWYYTNNGTLSIFENGNQITGPDFVGRSLPTIMSYTPLTALRVDYDGTFVNYYSGTNLIRQAYRPYKEGSGRLYFDSAFYSTDAGLSEMRFGTYALDNIDYILNSNSVWTIQISTSGDYGGALQGIYNRYPSEVPGNLLYDGWYLEKNIDEAKMYRIINATEKSNNIFNISCVEYNPAKYADIDTGVSLISVPDRAPNPRQPLIGMSILFRNQTGHNSAAGAVYNTYQTKGLNSIYYQITGGGSGPDGTGIVSLYKLYVSSGARRFAPESGLKPPEEDLLAVYTSRLPGTTYNPSGTPPFFTPLRTGDYFYALYAYNSANETSVPGTGVIQLAQQTIPEVIIGSGVNVL